MRKNRKILAVLLTLALALSLLPTMAFAEGCDHRASKNASDSDPAIVSTLVEQAVADAATYDCTKVNVLKAHYKCSVCSKLFTDYEETADAETKVIAEADQGTYLSTAETAHNWTTKAADKSTCGNTNCKKECVHTGKWTVATGTCSVCTYKCQHPDQAADATTCSICGATLTQPSEGTAPSITGTATAKSAGSNQFDVSYKYTAGTGDKAVAAETVTFSFALKDGSTAVTEGATVPQDATGVKDQADYTAALTVPEGTTAKTYTLTITATASNKAVATVDVTVSYAPTGTNPPVGDKATIASVAYDVATKTLSWTYTPASDAAKADPAFKVTLKSGSTVVKEAEDITATLTDGKYTAEYAPAGITFGDATAYTIVVSLSTDETVKGEVTVPAKGDQPGPVADKVENIAYNGTTLSWTNRGQTETFVISIRNAENDAVLLNPTALTGTKDGANYSCAYTLPNTCTAGMRIVISISAGTVAAPVDGSSGEFTYTVPTPGGSTTVDKNPDAMDGIASDATADTSIGKVESLLGIANTTTEADQAKAVMDVTTEELEKIQTANTTRNVTVSDTGSTVEVQHETKVLLGAAVAPNANVVLEVKDNGTQISKPSNAANAKTFAIDLTVNTSRVHAVGIYIPITLPVPTSFGSGTLKVIHHLTGGGTETITPTVVGTGASRVIRFATKTFSDFQLVEETSGSSGSNTPNKGSSTGGGKVTVTAPSTTTPTVTASGFSDVPDTHTFSAEIKWAKDNGYMNGTGEGVFSPTGTVNRQQIWMVLARMAGANPANMAEALTWAVENGISDGTNPTGAVSRQQLVTMMFRFAQKQENAPSEAGADISTFSDAAQVSGYAQEALAWSVANNIVGGTADGRLNPYGNATRGAFAAILYRYYN